ncbi:hypothetical protein Hanom_Chr14g01299941 [Helianthus anomalus]
MLQPRLKNTILTSYKCLADHVRFSVLTYLFGGDFDDMFSDAHCQRVINWISVTGGTSSAFDVTTKPVIFYNHFYDFGLRDVMTGLIEARKRAGIPPIQPIILSCSITQIISTGRFLVVSNDGVANEIDTTMKGEDRYYPVLWFHGLQGAIYTKTLASPNI